MGLKARSTLCTSSLRLVSFHVSKILSPLPPLQSLTRSDLVSSGTIGLLRAIDKYDADIAEATGASFATHAGWWIKASVKRAIMDGDDLVRVPVYVQEVVGKLGKLGGWDDVNGLGKRRGLSITHVTHALEFARRRTPGGAPLSLDDAVNPLRMGEAVVAEEGGEGSQTTAYDARMKNEETQKFLSRFLSRQESAAISLRYGLEVKPTRRKKWRDYEGEVEEALFGTASSAVEGVASPSIVSSSRRNLSTATNKALTFREVGKSLGVSAEYGRRLCNNAIEKLKLAVKRGEISRGEVSFLVAA